MLADALALCRRHTALVFATWLVLVGAVIWLSLSPRVQVPGGYDIDKLAHLLAYAALAGWPIALLAPWRAALICAMSAPLLGVLLEIGQTMVPGRNGDLLDAAANCAGALLGAMLACSVRPRP